jgi:hypothetical protein
MSRFRRKELHFSSGWRSRQLFLLKCWSLSTKLHGLTVKKEVVFCELVCGIFTKCWDIFSVNEKRMCISFSSSIYYQLRRFLKINGQSFLLIFIFQSLLYLILILSYFYHSIFVKNLSLKWQSFLKQICCMGYNVKCGCFFLNDVKTTSRHTATKHFCRKRITFFYLSSTCALRSLFSNSSYNIAHLWKTSILKHTDVNLYHILQ